MIIPEGESGFIFPARFAFPMDENMCTVLEDQRNCIR